MIVEGGIQGEIDAVTCINLNSIRSTAAVVDGNKHDLTNYITNGIAHPYFNTLLSNNADIHGVLDGQIGLIAQNQGQLINNRQITLEGTDTYGIQTLWGANVVNNGDIAITNGQ